MQQQPKTLLSLLTMVVCLCGCPEVKVPKAPPDIPKPKAALSLSLTSPAPPMAAM
jgi:hypothetical protein